MAQGGLDRLPERKTLVRSHYRAARGTAGYEDPVRALTLVRLRTWTNCCRLRSANTRWSAKLHAAAPAGSIWDAIRSPTGTWPSNWSTLQTGSNLICGAASTRYS